MFNDRDFSPLYSLKRKISNRSPQGRIEFVVTTMRHRLYGPLFSGECSKLSGRDFDACFEMGDGHDVAIGCVEQALKDPELEAAFKAADANWWGYLLDKYEKEKEIAPEALSLF